MSYRNDLAQAMQGVQLGGRMRPGRRRMKSLQPVELAFARAAWRAGVHPGLIAAFLRVTSHGLASYLGVSNGFRAGQYNMGRARAAKEILDQLAIEYKLDEVVWNID